MAVQHQNLSGLGVTDAFGVSGADPASGSALTSFLDSLRDGVVVVGTDRRIKYVNAAYYTQFGVGPEDIHVGAHIADVFRRLATNHLLGDRELTPDQIVERSLSRWGAEEGRVERRNLGNGRVLDIYRSMTLNDDVVSVHVDVTEAVRSAQEVERQRLYMEVLMENMSDGVSLLDSEGRFVMYNDKLLELYDVDPNDVYPGMPHVEFAAQLGDIKDLPERERDIEIEKRRKFAFDPSITTVRRRLRNGHTLHINKKTLHDGGFVLTYRDMTQDLKREEDLVHARQEAEESARSKSEFVARMSHEMRTPLNGILGVAALLSRSDLDGKQNDLVNIVSSSGKVLLRLIDDILDLSKIDAETFEVVEDRFQILEVIAQCTGIVRPSAAEKGLPILCDLPDDPVPELQGDMIRIKQILLNLMTNAVKFTENGHIMLGLAQEKGPEGITLTLSVSDTGMGIAEDKLGQIFDRFYQIDGSVTRRYGGAGLGLAITRKLVDAMGGAIQVESEPDRGTTFRVKLTLQPSGAGADEAGEEDDCDDDAADDRDGEEESLS